MFHWKILNTKETSKVEIKEQKDWRHIENQKQSGRCNPTVSIITLGMNGLNNQIKIQRLSVCL